MKKILLSLVFLAGHFLETVEKYTGKGLRRHNAMKLRAVPHKWISEEDMPKEADPIQMLFEENAPRQSEAWLVEEKDAPENLRLYQAIMDAFRDKNAVSINNLFFELEKNSSIKKLQARNDDNRFSIINIVGNVPVKLVLNPAKTEVMVQRTVSKNVEVAAGETVPMYQGFGEALKFSLVNEEVDTKPAREIPLEK